MSFLSALSPSPWPSESAVPTFFGRLELGADGRPTSRWEARSLVTVPVPYPLRLAWAPEQAVRKITCHRLVARSLQGCLAEVLAHYGSAEAVQAAGMDLFGGAYAFRPKAGGHTLSLHAYGIALDLDPEHNPPGKKWQEGKGMMPMPVVEIFETAGWHWGGRGSARAGARHFQAAVV